MNKSNLILASVSAIIFTSILIIFSPNSQKLNFSSSAPSPTPSQSISPTPDPTADWKTYENKEYGFEFKYPNTLSVTANTQERRFKLGEIGKKYDFEGSAYGYPIEISFFENDENKNITQLFEEYKKYLVGREESIFQKTKLDGYEAGIITNHLEITTFLPKDNYIIEISASLFREKDFNLPLESIYNQILSTIKFTDQAISSALEVAKKYLDASVIGDLETAKIYCPSMERTALDGYSFVKYEITGSKPDANPNYYHVYVKFTDKDGLIWDKAPRSNNPLELFMSKDKDGNWKSSTWYFYQ